MLGTPPSPAQSVRSQLALLLRSPVCSTVVTGYELAVRKLTPRLQAFLCRNERPTSTTTDQPLYYGGDKYRVSSTTLESEQQRATKKRDGQAGKNKMLRGIECYMAWEPPSSRFSMHDAPVQRAGKRCEHS